MPMSFKPDPSTPFNTVVAGYDLQRDFVFGQDVMLLPGQIGITNVSDLAQYFNSYADFTGTTTINSEMERYMPFSSSENFVFNQNNLALTGTLDSGGQVAPVVVATANSTGVYLNGTATPIAQLGLTNTTGITVGMIAFVLYSGIYYVSSLVPNVSVTLTAIMGSSTSTATNRVVFFLPYHYAVLNAQTSLGGTVLNFAAVPAGISVGMTIAPVINNVVVSNSMLTVISQTATSITTQATTAGSIPSGSGCIFHAPIRSAQIWSKDQYAPMNGIDFVAGELTFRLPYNAGSGGPAMRGASSASQFAALPTTAPWGSWPAFWAYGSKSPNLNAPIANSRDTSEIDFLEMQTSATQDARLFTGANHGTFNSVPIARNTNILGGGTWSDNYFYAAEVDLSLAVHKMQFIWTRDQIYRYIDGNCIQSDLYFWSSQALAQLGINLAIGGLTPGLAANFTMPYNNANFTMALYLYELKLWTYSE